MELVKKIHIIQLLPTNSVGGTAASVACNEGQFSIISKK